MRTLTLQEVAAAMGGRILGSVTVPSVSSISTDSRDLAPGSLFFAIRGAQYDGHAFVARALEDGAVAAVASDLTGIGPHYQTGGRLIHVSDTVAALGALAAWYRRQSAAVVIAVAGSNGKTTVKDMIATVLGSRKRGRAAPASFNNAIGVPLTLLSVEPPDEFIVVEIGTNHPGEVAALARMAQPDLAVITNISEEHLAFFGDVDAVAREEFSLLSHLRGRSLAAIDYDAAQYAPVEARQKARQKVKVKREKSIEALLPCSVLTYGADERADLWAADVTCDAGGQRFKVNGRFEYQLPLPGAHNVNNALAAVAIGTRFRMSHEEIAAALLNVKSPPMRMEQSQLGGITLINDAYNANPGSMRAAFDAMDRLPDAGRKVLILGDMLELGDHAARCHQAVGTGAGRSSAQVVIAVGTYARIVTDGATMTAGTAKRLYAFPTVDALIERIDKLIEPGDVVLLKASRGVRLERLAERLKKTARRSTKAATSQSRDREGAVGEL